MANPLNGTSYIVSFELGTGANKEALIAALKSYGTWGRVTNETWVIVALSDNAASVRDKLTPFIGTGGRIFIVKSGFEAAWQNAACDSEWLKKYLEN